MTHTHADSPAPQTERLLKRFAGTMLASIAVAVLFAGAYFHASSVGSCVNSVLAVRAQYTEADHANERQKIHDQAIATRHESDGLSALVTATTKPQKIAGFRLYQQGVTEFLQALDDWNTRDAAITKARNHHPLGQC